MTNQPFTAMRELNSAELDIVSGGTIDWKAIYDKAAAKAAAAFDYLASGGCPWMPPKT